MHCRIPGSLVGLYSIDALNIFSGSFWNQKSPQLLTDVICGAYLPSQPTPPPLPLLEHQFLVLRESLRHEKETSKVGNNLKYQNLCFSNMSTPEHMLIDLTHCLSNCYHFILPLLHRGQIH